MIRIFCENRRATFDVSAILDHPDRLEREGSRPTRVTTGVRAAMLGCLALVLGCGSSTGPIAIFVGSYFLQTVNAQPIPLQTTSPAGCPRSIASGLLSLTPPSANTEPLFSWGIRATDSCVGATPQPIFTASDHGTWRTDGATLFFTSSTGIKYRGTTGDGAKPTVVSIGFDGVSYRFTFASSSPF